MLKEDRSPEMVRLVYFLHRYARSSASGRFVPPDEFGDMKKREVYEWFFPTLGGSRTVKTFEGSCEGLRKGNIRENLEHGTPYLPMYEPILRTWQHLPRERQWTDLKQYLAGEDGEPSASDLPPSAQVRPVYLPLAEDRRKWTLRPVADRPGQGAFKAKLMDHYGCRCTVTGVSVREVIEAAHISPFRGVEDDHEDNGLLLRADIHTLFDSLLLGVLPDSLLIEMHPDIEGEYVEECEPKLLLDGRVRPSESALALHYAKFQDRLNLPVDG